MRFDKEAGRASLYIDFIWVVPEMRGRQIGRQLLLEGLLVGKQKDVRLMVAGSGANKAAVGLYESLGFHWTDSTESEMLLEAEQVSSALVAARARLMEVTEQLDVTPRPPSASPSEETNQSWSSGANKAAVGLYESLGFHWTDSTESGADNGLRRAGGPGRRVVGMLRRSMRFDKEAGRASLYIDFIWVVPEMRGRQIGRQLLLEGLLVGKQKDVRLMVAGSGANKAAVGLYQSLGFHWTDSTESEMLLE